MTIDLEEASKKARELFNKVSKIQYTINMARIGKAGVIEFTANQKTQLIDSYNTLKAEAVTLFQELP